MIKERIPNFVYEESEVLDALLNVIQEEFDRLRVYVEERILAWYLETSSGKDLDRMGLLVGEPRKGRDDENYRAAILSKTTSIVGTRDVLLNITRTLTDDTAQVEDMEPGVVKITINAETVVKMPQDRVKDAIKRVKAAGVKPHYNWRVFESTKDSLPVEESTRFPRYPISENVAFVENVEFPRYPIEEVHVPEENLDFSSIQQGNLLAPETTLNVVETTEYSIHPLPWTWGEAVAAFCEWTHDPNA